jgi:SAM-dependent methyltransferase
MSYGEKWAAWAEKRPEGWLLVDCEDGNPPLKLWVPANVFAPDPDWTGSPVIALRGLSRNLSGLKCLDLGTGTGILALACARRGAKRVVACDIDPVAVAAARFNVERHTREGMVIEVVESDMFAGLKEGERFDEIVANVPIHTTFWDQRTGGVVATFQKLLGALPDRLNGRTARALVTYADFGDPGIPELVEASPLLFLRAHMELHGTLWTVYEFRLPRS